MNKEFVPYEEALALKELGFNEQCFFVYNRKNELVQKSPTIPLEYCINIDGGHGAQCTAPLYQQAFRWFREKHNMLSNIYSNASGWCYEYHDNIGGTHRFDSGYTGDCEMSGAFTSYEKAELACSKKLIEIVKEKK